MSGFNVPSSFVHHIMVILGVKHCGKTYFKLPGIQDIKSSLNSVGFNNADFRVSGSLKINILCNNLPFASYT